MIGEALYSFALTKWACRHSRSRARFQRAQKRALDRWLAGSVPKIAAYQGFSGRLGDLPVMDKATLMGNFAAYNRCGFTDDQVRAAMRDGATLDGYLVGASTGTSGNRGLFVISRQERFRWLGSILAKTIPDMLRQRQRVAIILPQGGALYDSANRLHHLKLRLFELTTDPAIWRQDLERFAPSVIVAPPKILRYLVEEQFSLNPKRVFSAAETLEPVDQRVIERGFGSPLRQIYMASEGLLGVSCAHGRLHLAEDSVFFEYEQVGDGLANPLITSFRRDTQIMARYRMNDLLRLSAQSCPCGSPLQAVTELAGRLDDCFHLQGAHGAVMITPDVLRNAVLNADPGIDDFRLIQRSDASIELHLEPKHPPQTAIAAQQAVTALLSQRKAVARLSLVRRSFDLQTHAKLRRVERRLSP